MAEFSTDSVSATSIPLKKLSGRMLLGIVAGMVVFLVVPAVIFGWFAASDGLRVWQRIVFGLFACLLLALPIRVAVLSLRRKFTTGQWTPSAKERLRLRAKAAKTGTPSWMKYFDYALGPTWIAFALYFGFRYARGPQRDFWDVFLTGMYVVLATQSLWALYRGYRTSSKVDQPKTF